MNMIPSEHMPCPRFRSGCVVRLSPTNVFDDADYDRCRCLTHPVNTRRSEGHVCVLEKDAVRCERMDLLQTHDRATCCASLWWAAASDLRGPPRMECASATRASSPV